MKVQAGRWQMHSSLTACTGALAEEAAAAALSDAMQPLSEVLPRCPYFTPSHAAWYWARVVRICLNDGVAFGISKTPWLPRQTFGPHN